MSKLLGRANGYAFHLNNYNDAEFVTAIPKNSSTFYNVAHNIGARMFKRLNLQDAIENSVTRTEFVSVGGMR